MYIPIEPLHQSEKVIHICEICGTDTGKCMSRIGEICKATCVKICGHCKKKEKNEEEK